MSERDDRAPQRALMRQGRRRWLDALAGLTLALYALLVWASQAGGAAIDPVYADLRARGALRVAVDVGYRPFVDEVDGALVGYDIDLVRALAAELGVALELVPSGYDALYDQLSSGQADMIASALPYAPEQGYRARFSQIYFDGGLMLLAAADAPIAGPADLAGRRLGATLGSEGDGLARRLALVTPLDLRDGYEEPAALIADLRAGALDAAIVDNVVAIGAVAAGDLRVVAALSYEPYVLAMPRDAFQLAAEVDRALARLAQAGLLDELSRRWMVGMRGGEAPPHPLAAGRVPGPSGRLRPGAPPTPNPQPPSTDSRPRRARR